MQGLELLAQACSRNKRGRGDVNEPLSPYAWDNIGEVRGKDGLVLIVEKWV